MPRYTVMVDDNFHYMDEDERYEHGNFATADEALAACHTIVQRSLDEHFKPGMSAVRLYELYLSFGEDPFIIPVEADKVDFSARDFAWTRAQAMCATDGPA